MAITTIGTFAPHNINPFPHDRSGYHKLGNKAIYKRDCLWRKEDPATIVKWMRRNFGERNQGWDFSLAGGCVTIELWDDRLITMYEMWQM